MTAEVVSLKKLLVLAMLPGLLWFSACSKDKKKPTAQSSSSAAPTTTAVPVPTYPLTGLPIPGGPPMRPALSVKIDNVDGSFPQSGLNHADIVWEETFGRFDKDKEERDRARSEREEKESTPPKKIEGIGDEAYWSGGRLGGALYVLKNASFIRISVGGTDKEETKIAKSKALAEKALQRL